MNSSELLDQFRREMMDVEAPYLWGDDEIFAYINEAQTKFCQFTDGIPDARTPGVTTLEFTANDPWTTLSPLIRQVRRAWHQDTGEKVTLYTAEQAEDAGITFASDLTGPVTGIVIGLEKDAVRAVRVPTQAATIQLSVYRLPLVPITCDGEQAFEIPAQHITALLHWVKHRAYGKADSETFDRRKSEEYEGRFKAYCASAQLEQQRARRVHGTIAYGGL